MSDKKLIERTLKFSDRYIYLSTARGNITDGEFTCCDNCGKIIANICHIVRQSDNKHFYIGTDCAETLSKAKALFNNGQQSDFYLDQYSLNCVNRFATQFKKTPELVSINGAGKAEIVLTEMKEGKIKIKRFEAYLKDIAKYNPEIFEKLQTASK